MEINLMDKEKNLEEGSSRAAEILRQVAQRCQKKEIDLSEEEIKQFTEDHFGNEEEMKEIFNDGDFEIFPEEGDLIHTHDLSGKDLLKNYAYKPKPLSLEARMAIKGLDWNSDPEELQIIAEEAEMERLAYELEAKKKLSETVNHIEWLQSDDNYRGNHMFNGKYFEKAVGFERPSKDDNEFMKKKTAFLKKQFEEITKDWPLIKELNNKVEKMTDGPKKSQVFSTIEKED